jgi:DNA-binding transcriptional regulator GbsR (MarR family)
MSDSVKKWTEMQQAKKPDVTQREQDVDTFFVPKDEIVETVMNTFRERSERGINKYGTTLFDSNENCLAFINHLQEELMDAVLYAEKLKSFFK